MIPGIDVSHHQTKTRQIDWTAVRAAGVRWAYIKSTQGSTYLDGQAFVNRDGCITNKIPFGFYHFGDVTSSPEDNAIHFVNTISDKQGPGALPPVLAVEGSGGFKDMSAGEIDQWCLRFAKQYYTMMKRPLGLYGYTAGRSAEVTQSFPYLWIAQWTAGITAPSFTPKGAWNKWAFWQSSEKGQVPGIDGNVDLDWIASEAEFARLTKSGGFAWGTVVAIAAVALGAIWWQKRRGG